MQERPHLKREKVLAQESLRKDTYEWVRQVAQLVSADERLGVPYREGREIILPVGKMPQRGGDKESLRALVNAWMNLSPDAARLEQ